MSEEKPRIKAEEDIIGIPTPEERTHNLSTEGLTDQWPRPLPEGATIIYRIPGTTARGTGRVIQAGELVVMIEEGMGTVKFVFYTEIVNVYLTG